MKGLDMRSIFRCMMEDGYYPSFDNGYILFDFEGNTAVVEYEENILSVRLFFTIDAEDADALIKASKNTMTGSLMVKPVVMEKTGSIMFSCEMMCDTRRQFRKFFPRSLNYLKEALEIHKVEMQRLMTAATSESYGTVHKTSILHS